MAFFPIALPSLSDVILAKDAADQSARDALRAGVQEGQLLHIARGIYAPSTLDATPRNRHLMIALGSTAIRREPLVFSHLTAALIWGLPLWGDPPDRVHAVTYEMSGGRSDELLVRHCEETAIDVVRFGDFLVTSLERTLLDVARLTDFRQGVLVADAALAGRTRDGSRADLDEVRSINIPGRRGSARARRVTDFADGDSGSPGETVSRVSISLAGLPAPALQERFVDAEGEIFTDFSWKSCGVVGEFDGVEKYVRDEYTHGRPIADIVLAEKHREDRIRRLGPTVVRWGKDIAASPSRLGAKLRAGGVR